jgi:hypothetical protein
MQNKQLLHDLVTRAERGALLAGEAQILRDAIELLDEMTVALEFRLFAGDDDAPGRP